MEYIGIDFQLEHFHGPMDLLLHLIERDKIPIGQISIAKLCDQYIAFLQPHLHRDLHQISAFVLMAARLLELKARSLLPKKDKEDALDDEEEFAKRLAQYQQYKRVAQMLQATKNSDHYYRPKNPEIEGFSNSAQPEIDEILRDLSILDLEKIYRELLARKPRPPITNTAISTIHADPLAIMEKINELIEHINKVGKTSFDNLLSKSAKKSEKLVTFLALLELAKTNFVHISQNYLFSEINLELFAANIQKHEQQHADNPHQA
ncbi:MAG: segregation/condensation protein A [Defluviitaleaceae bacterium]|nr:segregation/condensation protein A [Defluviitaleaceae bacterium]